MVVLNPVQRIVEEKFITLLRSCKTYERLHQIQAQLVTHGLEHNDFVAPNFITTCSRFKRMHHARKLFDKIPQPNTATWNAMFRGYLQNEHHRDAIVLFGELNRVAGMPNCFTFPMIIKSCGKLDGVIEGEEVHCCATKRGFKSNPFVATSLIDMYSRKGCVDDAYKVFGEMRERNVVVWTAIINGYILCGDVVSGRRLFDLAPERDVVMWSVSISGYIESKNMVAARELFDKMPNRDTMSWNAMLNGYAVNGEVEMFEKVFDEMPERNVFSWNGFIGGYVKNGLFSEALESFKRMLVEGHVVPNDFTLVAVLSACSRLGALDMGKWVHVYAESIGYKGNLFVGNALIDMYAKCGVIENAVVVFNCLDRKDIISWNTIINGLAIHGHAPDALSMFDRMKSEGEEPDGVTFVGILSACTHMGLVKDGFLYFKSMVDHYSIVPQIEHYGCMVDLLGRAGLLDQALNFIRKMPIEPDAVIWAALLGACRLYKNVEIAELALQRLIELEPNNPANFVMVSNIYKDLGRSEDVARLKIAMRDTGFRKLPGCSVIECNDSVVEFYSLDERHSETESIYRVLKGLTMLLRSRGYVPNLSNVAHGLGLWQQVRLWDPVIHSALLLQYNSVQGVIFHVLDVLQDDHARKLAMLIWSIQATYNNMVLMGVKDSVERGGVLKEENLRPEIPRCCPSSLANVIKRCWDANPDKRPEMDEVVTMLEAIDTSKGGGMIPLDQPQSCLCFRRYRGP